MLLFERIAVVFFAALAVAAVALRRRPRASSACALSVAVVAVIVLTSRAAPAVRAWAAHGYLVAGYWIPSLLAVDASGTRFERWLVSTERILGQRTISMPSWLVQLCELAYLLCYPVIPAAFALVWMRGGEADLTRFWVAVLVAGFACYGSLPWLVSRPPRLLAGASREARGIAQANAIVLNRMSHRLNTFPSGHVAVTIAAALSLWPVSPPAAAVVGAIAGGVAVGAVTGRYHYVLDVLAGALIGVLSAAAASAMS